MAIDREVARLLLSLEQGPRRREKALMLGRQNFLLRGQETRKLCREFGKEPTPEMLTGGSGNQWPFAEPFLRMLGFQNAESMDLAPYEGANHLHDLNEPLPNNNWVEAFDLVLDGGTLEHIFNFPQGLVNALQMVRQGGYFVSVSPANNWLGHGFYQLSPELYYRTLCPAHGVGRCWVILCTEGLGLKRYLVNDPELIESRTNLINDLRTTLLVVAQKTGPTPSRFEAQQSDYKPYWAKQITGLNDGKSQRNYLAGARNYAYQLAPELTRRIATLEARPWSYEYSIGRVERFQPLNNTALKELWR